MAKDCHHLSLSVLDKFSFKIFHIFPIDTSFSVIKFHTLKNTLTYSIKKRLTCFQIGITIDYVLYR